MSETINPMKKQAVYAEGKPDFVNGKYRGYNPYTWRFSSLDLPFNFWRHGYNP